MKKILWLWLFLAIGCGSDPAGKIDPPSKATIAPPLEEIVSSPTSLPPEAPLPEGARLLASDFNSFDDPVSPEGMAKGHFFKGNWSLSDGAFEQSELGSGQALTMRRWRGDLPSRYRVEVACWPTLFTGRTPERIDKSVGVLALLPVFRDETHFLIFSARSKDAEAWLAEGFLPGVVWPDTNKLWGGSLEPTIGIGGALSLGADVDLDARTVKLFLNGQDKGTVKLKAEFNVAPNSFVLANNGSKVRFGRIRVYALPGATEASPSAAI